MQTNRKFIKRTIGALFLSTLLGLTGPARAQERSADIPLAKFGVETEFISNGNHARSWADQQFMRFQRILGIVAGHYGGTIEDIKLEPWVNTDTARRR